MHVQGPIDDLRHGMLIELRQRGHTGVGGPVLCLAWLNDDGGGGGGCDADRPTQTDVTCRLGEANVYFWYKMQQATLLARGIKPFSIWTSPPFGRGISGPARESAPSQEPDGARPSHPPMRVCLTRQNYHIGT